MNRGRQGWASMSWDGKRTSRRCVLVIDDDDDIRAVTTLSMQAVAGWRVLTAADGQTGVQLTRDEHPDAVPLDVMMPNMDGYAVLRAVRADPSTAAIPVVLLTARSKPARDTPTELADATITKPFDPMRLPSQLAELLGWADE